MSGGLDGLSDADLMRMLGETRVEPGPAAPPHVSSLADLSDADLMRQLGAAKSEPSVVADVAKSVPSGLARGVMSLAGLPADAMNLVDRGWQNGMAYVLEKTGALTPEQAAGIKEPIPGLDGPKETRARGILPTSGLLKDAVDAGLKRAGLPEMHKPQTVPGEVANTVAEFAPNALGGVATAAGKVAQVVVPALASEGAGQAARHVAPDLEPVARFAGAIGGGVGTALAQSPRGGPAALRSRLDGTSPEALDEAMALMERSRALPGGGVPLSLDEALNQVTGGQATRVSQLARVVANDGGEGGRIASEFYAARPAAVEGSGRAALDTLGRGADSPSALGTQVQEAAQAGVAATPQGMALTQALNTAGERITPDQAGRVIQPELRRAYERREGMRAALGEQDYAAAKAAPETVGIERTIDVERPGEPIVTRPAYGRPRFEEGAPRPAEPYASPTAEAAPSGKSLARFIAENGGLRLDGDAAANDLHRFSVPGVGKVARPDGKGIDNFWRERLIEEGYFRPDADGGMARDITNELLRKLQNEQRGHPSYPLDGPGRAKGRGAAARSADEYDAARSTMETRLDEDLTRAGVSPTSVHPDIRERAIGALMRGEHTDPLDAYERVVGAMKGPLDPYVKSTTIREEIPDVRFGQANPQGVLDHVNEAMRSAKGPVLLALQQARKTLFENDGKTLDLSIAGLHGAREAINDMIGKADPTAQRALMGVRDRLDRSLSTVPEYEAARAGFEAASRPLDAFAPGSAPGRVVGQDQASGRFAMPRESAPAAIDGGPSAQRDFLEAASPAAREAYERHLTTRILDGASDPQGALDAGKLRTALRDGEDTLALFPVVRERLEGALTAREGLAAVERSPLGRIAAKPDVRNAIDTLFPSGRNALAGGEKEIGAAMGALTKADPQAARQLARIYMETVFDQAMRETRGLPQQYGGAGFASAVAGGAQQRKNLEAAVKALPEGDALWTGFERLMETLRATGYRPQRDGGAAFNSRVQDELAGGKTVAGAIANALGGATAGGSVMGMTGAAGGAALAVKRSASDAWTRYQTGRSGAEVARLLFDPRAMPDLRALARSNPGSKNIETFTARIMALANGRAAEERDRGAR